MPIAFILVAMITSLTIWMSGENRNAQIEEQRVAEAQYVATNMISYQSLILAYANLTDANGALVNKTRFAAANGDAANFIAACDAVGAKPNVMGWWPGPRPGVKAQIVNKLIIVEYFQPDDRYPTQRGVQAELFRFAGSTSLTGRSLN